MSLASSEEGKELLSQLRGPMLEAGRKVAGATIEGQVSALTSALQMRTEVLNTGGSLLKPVKGAVHEDEEEGEEEEQPAEDEYEEEDEEEEEPAEDEDRAEDTGEEEEEPAEDEDEEQGEEEEEEAERAE